MSAPVAPWRANAVVVTMAVGGLALVTNEVLPFGLINLMATGLDRSQSQIGLLVTGYALVIVVMSVPLAVLTRNIPRRYVLSATFTVWAGGAVMSALAVSYHTLLAGRLMTALAQAMYWAVASATVAGLFPPERRGKAISLMLIGPASAGALGLPTLTRLGQETEWRMPFWVLAVVGISLAIAAVVLIPSYRPSEGGAARGSHPNVRRFVMLLFITMVGVVGIMVVFTYITPFLNEVAGFSEEAIPAILVAQGAVGMVAMVIVGRYLDRYPRACLAVGIGWVLMAWIGLGAFGTNTITAAVVFIAMGVGFSTMVASMMNRALQLSPGSTDIGVATYSSFYNAGIAVGSWVGAALLASSGAAVLPWAGAIALVAALLLLLSTNWVAGVGLAPRQPAVSAGPAPSV